MVNVRVRPETDRLVIDFRYRGKRCREYTALTATPANRRLVEGLARRIERELAQGTFQYDQFFPESPRAKQFSETPMRGADNPGLASSDEITPTLADFAELWFRESEPLWRTRYRGEVRATMDKHLLPALGDKPLSQITRADILGFRAEFAKRDGHGGRPISPQRVNKVVRLLRSILDEGCDRFGLISPGRSFKPLKQTRPEIQPFSLEEINRMVDGIRPDFRNYLVTRFYTGLRTGEINGLQWTDIDFDKQLIEVRRSASRGGDGGLKSASSRRAVPMVPLVLQALRAQREAIPHECPWVFATRGGSPIDEVNFCNRIWKPLLRHLDLAPRAPYQTRHTAATLMLASGENPEWVARVLGHSTTEMLFRVYSRFIPNVTRQDGRAFTGMVSGSGASPKQPDPVEIIACSIAGLSAEQMRELLQSIAVITATSTTEEQ